MNRSPSGLERERWRPMSEAMFRRIRDAEARDSAQSAMERRARMAALDAAIESARAWMDAGFPEHPVLGIHDWPVGGGGSLQFIDWPTDTAGWVGHDSSADTT